MAKNSKRPTGGPYLAAAFFCEKVIEDKADGAMTAVRVVDQFTVTLPHNAPPDIPSKEKMVPVEILGLLAFRSGYSPGRHAVRLRLVSPSGKAQTAMEQEVELTPKVHGGASIRLQITVFVHTGGLFWLDVYLDGRRFTRMPFHIDIRRAAPPEPPGAETPPPTSQK
jgi:hypothetical protein